MLTKTLLATTYRQGKVYPFKLPTSKKNLELSERLICLFKESVGRNRVELEECLKGFNIKGVNPKTIQGLGKLLFDRSEFTENQKVDYPALRKAVFDRSASYWRNISKEEDLEYKDHQNRMIESLPEQYIALSQQSPNWLYGDNADNQKLCSFKDLTAEALIHRFNISQVQGVLLDTKRLRLKVNTRFDASLKQVFQLLKFFQLMFSVVDSNETEIIFEIDGPASVLENARSYGLEIANFFPAILLLNTSWEMEATIKRKGVIRDFKLTITSDNPYQTFYPSQKQWLNNKVEELVVRFNEKYGKKNILATCDNSIFPLSENRYLLPDLKIAKGDKVYYVEWIRYLSEAKLNRLKTRIKDLPKHYLFAIKGKRTKLSPLLKGIESRFLIYSSNLTANGLYKILT